ncbi:RdgB/HAM1 family non-canonical purine NTP pyrophosphatase [Proteinivorax hydrogeniformans]|uniref:dITP/XTP pyrophosphatase n=1 Tax=Proteinivorax hydrogeniformans TaxID=1826727 RepID=A0AAU8HWC7_9FIRM
MTKLLLATGNYKKIEEISNILGEKFQEFLSFADYGLVSPSEDADTFAGNALIKARYGSQKTGLPTLADDSGLCVKFLDGEPGIHSARYSETGDDISNYKKLLENLKGVSNEKRYAYFHTSIALVYPSGRTVIAHGKLEGYITSSPKGNNGFGYDPVFYLPEFKKTLAELDPIEKNAISHRRKALENLQTQLKGE